MRSDPSGLITPMPLPPSSAAVVASLVEDLQPFADDGSAGLHRLVARIPLLLDVDRAYIGRISPDGVRFAATQASTGDWPDLLGYTQSVARLPAFARGTLKSGVQGSIEDAATFPFTPQQRKMMWYAGLGATVVTPIPSGRVIVGALVVDVLKQKRVWDSETLDALKTLSLAIGARIALASLGDHLTSREGQPEGDMMRLNVLANVAKLLERSTDPAALSNAIADVLGGLAWVRTAKWIDPADPSEVMRDALAAEGLVVRAQAGICRVGLPIVYDGERFGGIELELTAESLTDLQSQFLRTAQVFTSSAYVSALRRARPRDESLTDALTGLPSFRSINEDLTDAVYAAKLSRRPVSIWLLDIEGLEAINRDHGYAIGDDVVGYVGHTLGAVVAPRGAAGRVGGGMFLAVFPNMDLEEATVQGRMMVERISKNVPAHLPQIGLTIGVSSFPAQAVGHDDLVRTARLALYVAKNGGANRVVAANAKDEAWVRDARTVFVRIVTEQQMPVALQDRLRK